MPKLKKYDQHTKILGSSQDYIPSGVKSPNSDAEMMVIRPYKEHPEIKGLYRAIDPTDEWRGWVEFTPPVDVKPIPAQSAPVPQPTKKEIERDEFLELFEQLQRKEKLVKMGILTETDIRSLKERIIRKYKDEYIDYIRFE